ncbi:GntR family transcriptional regulator [Paraburkholderia sacchari]|uniref:GntR family transcriptional regulator n=1 Tax=Paraburkholderia sacchari TaxID=159450 RepID=UPI0005419BDC|nr:GntR family transcriptional regulator [Paraburkholderia sacchari]NLP60668.1 GntR family transcriptional regulator [Paraburkholderia sacchari]
MSEPRFKQIEKELRRRILDNHLSAGMQLPSEAALMEEFGVSRITVRQSLAGLHASGLIEKVNGKGSFVTRPEQEANLGPLTGFYEAARARGKTAHGKLVSVREIKAPDFARDALGLDANARVLCASTIRMLDSMPVAWFRVMGAPPLIEALVREDIETNDASTILENRLGYRLKDLQAETSAIAAGSQLAQRLDIAVDAPVLRIRCTPYDARGEAVCCSEFFLRGDVFSYRFKLSR